MQDPTPRQLEIRAFIATFIEANGRGPSAAIIQAHFRFRSKNAVLDHLNHMQKKGMIYRPPYKNALSHQSTTAQITLTPPTHPACCPHCRRPFGT